MYFIVTIKFDQNVAGKIKSAKEQYMFDALSYTEAEARAVEELTPCISGEFTIEAIKKTRVSELMNVDSLADRWYKVKVAFITLDEKTATEKKSVVPILVRAEDFGEAVERFMDGMSGTISDFEIISIAETPILDYFPTK